MNAYRATFATNLVEALEHSESHTEIVRVRLMDMTPLEALQALDAAWEFGWLSGWEYYDYTATNEGTEAWFERSGGEARVQFCTSADRHSWPGEPELRHRGVKDGL